MFGIIGLNYQIQRHRLYQNASYLPSNKYYTWSKNLNPHRYRDAVETKSHM